MLGMTEMFRPRFVRRYMDLASEAKDAFRKYIKDVKDKKFPGKGESY
jgi:3-methyl-2-oxobutanoate hydroxymethyltransferase